jgi:ABC-type polar amino acid transport system ATPase subunit
VVVIIGPSGSGKSTFLRCLNGLEEIDSGLIVIDGIVLNRKKKTGWKFRKEVGMVFQSFNLFPHMTVLENINLAQRKVRKIKALRPQTIPCLFSKSRNSRQSQQLSASIKWRTAAASRHCTCFGYETQSHAF